MTISDLTNGQTFTNGSTEVRFQLLNIETLSVENLNTKKVSTFNHDTHVYLAETLEIYTDYKGNKVSLTENEIEVVKELDYLIFEEGTIVYLDELDLSISTRKARGVLSSLIKKNVCSLDEGMISYSMPKY